MSARKLVKLLLAGSLTGALLAMTAPPQTAIARTEEGCKCDDGNPGTYKCNSAQTACIAGSELCVLVCGT